MIFKSGTNDLPLVVEVFRTDEAHYAVHEKGIESASDAISTSLERQLIDPVMGLRGERAALARLEIHDVVSNPLDLARPMMFNYAFAALVQHGQRDSETSIRGFRSRNRLKE